MKFEPTAIPEVILIRPDVFSDSRGYFFESWQLKKFAAAGLDLTFVQENNIQSSRHTLRGLHYQVEQAQGKLVRVVRGTVFDVAVDLRESSPTFARWIGVVLSGETPNMLWVPPGFAHGVLVLSDSADFHYCCTDFWSAPHERAIHWKDPDLNISWPLPSGVSPVLSAKDAAADRLRDAEYFPRAWRSV
jgi:dTDP-4-dehydrorhamnose 3,5-epimerase